MTRLRKRSIATYVAVVALAAAVSVAASALGWSDRVRYAVAFAAFSVCLPVLLLWRDGRLARRRSRSNRIS